MDLKTHKMLWGKSGNICAFPDCKKELVMDISETDDLSVIGEEAHIVARKEDGPRGISPLTDEDRDKYSNLILLCSIHHKIIDDHPTIYTVDILQEYKKNHEKWIKENLKIDNQKEKTDLIYSSYIDQILVFIDVDNFKGWTSYILGGDYPRIWKTNHNNLQKLKEYIISRVWPHKYPKLECSIINIKNIVNDLLLVFDEYAEDFGRDMLATRKFYKIKEWDPEEYDKLHKKYMYHVALVEDLVFELTRALNYLFDKIREFIFPSYRLDKGVLLIEMGPFMDFTWRTYRLEYKEEEKTDYPYPNLKEFMSIRESRDRNRGQGYSSDYFPPVFN